MATLDISIAICTINPNTCLRLLCSLMDFKKEGDQIIVFVDGETYMEKVGNDFTVFCRENQIELLINKDNRGLSYCRNVAMKEAQHRYLIFFDDDTILINDTLCSFREQFQKGKTMGGARLALPETYKKKTRFLSKGYSYLFAVHHQEEKIWGACFGFDVQIAREYDLFFNQNLGRKGRGLQSGDDTLFVKEYLEKDDNAFFVQTPVLHKFDPNRLKIKYIVRRVFWQGRSEIRRYNFKAGWKKERSRSATNENLIQIVMTIFLRVVFLVGCLWEKISSVLIEDDIEREEGGY